MDSPAPSHAGAPAEDAGDEGLPGTIDASDVDGNDSGEASVSPLCSGQPGAFHSQVIMAGGLTRDYFLYVPESYDCTKPYPLLVDFHGTAFPVADGTPPEELWALPGLENAADKEGFLVVRPRSLSFDSGGTTYYQWDAHPGDLELNKAYARTLVGALRAEYNIDPSRTYASGFSNGTNMAAQFMGDQPPFFSGYGIVGGGIWDTFPASLAGATFRVYDTTGYRDELRPVALGLYDWLNSNDYPSANLWVRETNAGHELYGWQYEEFFRWLDRGERPPPGTLSNGFTREALPTTAQSLLHLSPGMTAGQWIASGTGGILWSRSPAGDWTASAPILPSMPTLALDGVCTTSGGATAATGDGAFALLATPGGAWQVNPTLVASASNPQQRLEFLSCAGGDTLVGTGPSYALMSSDLGTSWTADANIDEAGDTPSVNSIAKSAAGTSIAVGAIYIGRSTDGVNFTWIPTSTSAVWLYGVASAPGGTWWVVGEAGTILSSTDDGQSWQAQTTPTTDDLYAVSFADASRGVAVGLHGAALLTTNGGAAWTDISTGLDAMNSDVAWLNSSTVLVVGGNGTAITRSVP